MSSPTLQEVIVGAAASKMDKQHVAGAKVLGAAAREMNEQARRAQIKSAVMLRKEWEQANGVDAPVWYIEGLSKLMPSNDDEDF